MTRKGDTLEKDTKEALGFKTKKQDIDLTEDGDAPDHPPSASTSTYFHLPKGSFANLQQDTFATRDTFNSVFIKNKTVTRSAPRAGGVVPRTRDPPWSGPEGSMAPLKQEGTRIFAGDPSLRVRSGPSGPMFQDQQRGLQQPKNAGNIFNLAIQEAVTNVPSKPKSKVTQLGGKIPRRSQTGQGYQPNPRQSLHDAPPLPPRASTSAFMKRSFSSTSQNDESVDAANKEEEAGAAKVIENSFHIKGRGRKTTSVGTHKPPPGFKKEEDEKVSKPGGKGKGKAVKPPVEVIELDSSGDEDHVGDLEMTPPRGKKQKVEVEVKGKGTAKQKESDDEIEPFSDEEKARDLSSDPLAMSFSRDIPRGTVAKRREAYEPARPVVSNMRRRNASHGDSTKSTTDDLQHQPSAKTTKPGAKSSKALSRSTVAPPPRMFDVPVGLYCYGQTEFPFEHQTSRHRLVFSIFPCQTGEKARDLSRDFLSLDRHDNGAWNELLRVTAADLRGIRCPGGTVSLEVDHQVFVELDLEEKNHELICKDLLFPMDHIFVDHTLRIPVKDGVAKDKEKRQKFLSALEDFVTIVERTQLAPCHVQRLPDKVLSIAKEIEKPYERQLKNWKDNGRSPTRVLPTNKKQSILEFPPKSHDRQLDKRDAPAAPRASTSNNDVQPLGVSTRRSARRQHVSPSPPPVSDNTPPEKVVLVWPWTGVKGAVSVTHRDVGRLAPEEFLNDTLIELGLKRIFVALQENNPELASTVHMFNSFFYKKLSAGKSREVTKEAYESVRKWTSKFDLFNKKYIIVPINEHLHWYLAIIVNPAFVLGPPETPTRVRRTRASGTTQELENPDAIEQQSTTSGDMALVDEDEMAAEQKRQFREKVKKRGGKEDDPATEVTEGVKGLAMKEADTSSDSDMELDVDSDSEQVAADLQPNRPTLPLPAALPIDSVAETPPSSSDSPLQSTDGPLALNGENTNLIPEARPLTSTPILPTLIAPSLVAPGEPVPTDEPVASTSTLAPSAPELTAAETSEERHEDKWVDPCHIFTFDSLSGSHNPVINKLRKYLDMEALNKKNVAESSYMEVIGKTASVPTQENFCDCGLYLLHYVEKFLHDPEGMTEFILTGPKISKSTTCPVSAKWGEAEAKVRREAMKNEVTGLCDQWAEVRKPIEEQERIEKAEKKRLKDEQAQILKKLEEEKEEARRAAELAAKREEEEATARSQSSVIIELDDSKIGESSKSKKKALALTQEAQRQVKGKGKGKENKEVSPEEADESLIIVASKENLALSIGEEKATETVTVSDDEENERPTKSDRRAPSGPTSAPTAPTATTSVPTTTPAASRRSNPTSATRELTDAGLPLAFGRSSTSRQNSSHTGSYTASDIPPSKHSRPDQDISDEPPAKRSRPNTASTSSPSNFHVVVPPPSQPAHARHIRFENPVAVSIGIVVGSDAKPDPTVQARSSPTKEIWGSEVDPKAGLNDDDDVIIMPAPETSEDSSKKHTKKLGKRRRTGSPDLPQIQSEFTWGPAATGDEPSSSQQVQAGSSPAIKHKSNPSKPSSSSSSSSKKPTTNNGTVAAAIVLD